MTSTPQAFLALDLGTATSSAALVGRVGRRWRLLGSTSQPATIPIDPAIARLVDGVRGADPDLADELGLASAKGRDTLPRLVATTYATPRMAVLAATARELDSLLAVADRAGWRATGLSADRAGRLDLLRLVLERDARAILLGSGEPAGSHERSSLGELVNLVAGAAARRPEVDIVLAGSVAGHAAVLERRDADGNGHGGLLLGPAASAGTPRGEPLRVLLAGLREHGDDGRAAIARATATLAEVLERTVETIEIGMDAGLRAIAGPAGAGATVSQRAVLSASAALFPPHPDEAILDGIVAWSTVQRDRHRLRDRLLDLRRMPWSDADGDGAQLRMAAARAAVARLLARTPDLEPVGAPDLVVASGGVWAVAPGPAVTLALADVVRRPGVSQYAFDHARLLGPLGTIGDPDERREIVADLADDLLTPLGSVVVAGGVRGVHDGGRIVVRTDGASSELALVPGALQLVDVPPGQLATAELQFREPVVLGTRGRRFEVEVSGGLGGLLVDLRDIPLRFPERSERRRELLAAWQAALWTGVDQ